MQTIDKATVVTKAMLKDLPQPVQRYMAYTGIIGAPWIDTVRLTYSGQFRLAADKPWTPIHAEQVYTTDPPGFQWKAHLKLFGLPLMFGQDTYKDGEGHMFGKLAGLFTIFDERGEKLLQGAMVRYLQEMMWFPTAYLSEYVTWEAVDNHAANVTYADGDKSVTGRMYFDEAGRVLSFVACRYRENQGTYTLNNWATPMTEYGAFAGLRLPRAGCGVWELPDGDLSYINIRLTDARYNVPIPPF